MRIAEVVAQIGSMRTVTKQVEHPAHCHRRDWGTDNGDGDCPGIYMLNHIKSFPANQ